MKHLLNYDVFKSLDDIPGTGSYFDRLKAIGCDGLELFTLYDKVPEMYRGLAVSAHLPFAIDWYSGWTESIPEDEDDEEGFKYISFGRTKDEVIDTIRNGITRASDIGPAYGVLHGGNTDLDEVLKHNRTDSSRVILEAFTEMMNQVVSGFKGNEPPFKLAFENLWWSGLKLTGTWEYELLDKRLEFDNWGFCLDTGHMMNTLPDAYDEERGIEGLLRIFDGLSQDLKDRVGTVHLQLSASAEYRNTFPEQERPKGETMAETIARSYPHISKVDQHRPFSDPRCKLLIEELSPDYVTHEMLGSGPGGLFGDFTQQRSLF